MHRVRTGDGWPVTLYEYDPSGPDRKPVPVILCHGSYCRYNFYDIGGGEGFAPWLAARGYRVFSVDLRGRGRSVPGPSDEKPRNYRRWHWRVHDIIEFDIPAIVEVVVRLSGSPAADYVGHSMGGIVGFSHLFRTQDPRVRKMVAAGTISPRTGHRLMKELESGGDTGAFNLMELMQPIGRMMPFIPLQPAARIAAQVLPGSLLHRQPAFNFSNMEDRVMRFYMRKGTVNVSAAKMASFKELFAGAEGERLASRARDYTHPTLWISGEKDFLVPPKWVRSDFEHSDVAGKHYVNFAQSEGFSADYGHGDLFVGRNAHREVFPEIARWLER